MAHVIIVTQVPPGAEAEAWTWKYFLIDGIMKTFIDNEDKSYVIGIEDGITMLMPSVTIECVTVHDMEADDHWGLDTYTAEEQNESLQAQLEFVLKRAR